MKKMFPRGRMNSFVSVCDREKNLAMDSRHPLKGTFRGKLLSLQETLVLELGNDFKPDLLCPTPGIASLEAIRACSCSFLHGALVSTSG